MLMIILMGISSMCLCHKKILKLPTLRRSSMNWFVKTKNCELRLRVVKAQIQDLYNPLLVVQNLLVN